VSALRSVTAVQTLARHLTHHPEPTGLALAEFREEPQFCLRPPEGGTPFLFLTLGGSWRFEVSASAGSGRGQRSDCGRHTAELQNLPVGQ